MRSLFALQTSFSMLLAFVLAPFAHIHTGTGPDHEHSGLIHSHFYPLHVPSHRIAAGDGRTVIDDDDDHATVQPVDTFTLVLTAGFAPFVPARAIANPYEPSEISRPVEFIEERGNGPPSRSPSIPRAPPF
jgi:hypothetical protein